MSGTDKPATAGAIDEAEEARNLAQEALEAAEQGDREESKFLAEEARALDRKAADEVLADKKVPL